MTVPRLFKVGIAFLAMLVGIFTPSFMANGTAATQYSDLHQYCRKVGNDDTIRKYSHALYEGTVKAFRKLSPGARSTPADSSFLALAKYRCMDGRVMACFLGANLPCLKLNTARDNPGADAFCRENPNSDFVPLVATGHDTVYAYRCRNGKAEITEETRKLDKRGFAKKLWTVLPDR